MANLWERDAGETDKAFAAFVAYRELGTGRSLEKVGAKWGKTGGYQKVLERWSSQYDWGKRVSAYDDHLAGIAVQSVENGIREDRVAYREKVKAEASDFALAAVAMRREAMMRDDKAEGSLILQRASSVWEKARMAEGLALGLVTGS